MDEERGCGEEAGWEVGGTAGCAARLVNGGARSVKDKVWTSVAVAAACHVDWLGKFPGDLGLERENQAPSIGDQGATNNRGCISHARKMMEIPQTGEAT